MTELDKEDAKGIKAAGLENAKPEEEDIVERAVEIVKEGRKYGLEGDEYHPLEDDEGWEDPSFNVHLGVFNRFSRYLLEEEEQEHYTSLVFPNWRDLDLSPARHSPSIKEQVEGSIVYRVALSIEKPRKAKDNLVKPDEGMSMIAHNNRITYRENQWDDLRNILQEYAEEDKAAAWEEHHSIRMYAYKMEPNSG